MRPGDTLAASLHGILDGWPISATATVLDIVPGRPAGVLLAVTSPDSGRQFYAQGITSSTLDDSAPTTVQRLTTTGMQPSRITLGQPIQFGTTRPDSSTLDASQDEAYTALSPYYGSLTHDGPLTAHSLPMLDRALRNITNQRNQTTAAEQARDDLIRRLLAGGVDPKTLIARTGLSRSRIHQIGKPQVSA